MLQAVGQAAQARGQAGGGLGLRPGQQLAELAGEGRVRGEEDFSLHEEEILEVWIALLCRGFSDSPAAGGPGQKWPREPWRHDKIAHP